MENKTNFKTILVSKQLEKPFLNMIKMEILNNNIKIKNLEIEIQRNNIEKQKILNNINPDDYETIEKTEEFWNNIENELKNKIKKIENINNELLSIQVNLTQNEE